MGCIEREIWRLQLKGFSHIDARRGESGETEREQGLEGERGIGVGEGLIR